ncbi:cupin domain-containing protein [Glycomyces harbinensis]|uniref:Cupin domain-containing protein n=1 Tax=Glycomyces harbinensis TaxID=58114 RepID=A0A1G6XK01_9ACTN|nr:cupin domain-containing protein [Glycomyces harbinensis]SDD78500.1 Cupin domain-containing protein [Glycomyces harbinensis]
MIQIIDPFAASQPIWLGLDQAGFRRKVFKVADEALNGSEFLVSGLTIFEPGESSSLHNHPESEEVDFIVRGHGEVVSEDGGRTPFATNTFMFIPKGVMHQHVNTGREPLWLVFVYGPHGELPTT